MPCSTILRGIKAYWDIFRHYWGILRHIQTSLLNYVPHVPSCLTCLRPLRAFVSHVPSCLTHHRALLTHFIYAPCVSFSLALHALFVRLKIFLGWICSPAKTFYFPSTIKDTTNPDAFMWVKKQQWNFLSGEIF